MNYLKLNDSKMTGITIKKTPIYEEERKITVFNKDLDSSSFFKSEKSVKSTLKNSSATYADNRFKLKINKTLKIID